MRETDIMRAVRKAVNLDGRALITRNNVGVGRAMHDESVIRFGLGVGSPDLVGILRGSARGFALEIKTPVGRLSPEQRAWATAFRKHGGFCAVVRSVHEALAAVERALAGASE